MHYDVSQNGMKGKNGNECLDNKRQKTRYDKTYTQQGIADVNTI